MPIDAQLFKMAEDALLTGTGKGLGHGPMGPEGYSVPNTGSVKGTPPWDRYHMSPWAYHSVDQPDQSTGLANSFITTVNPRTRAWDYVPHRDVGSKPRPAALGIPGGGTLFGGGGLTMPNFQPVLDPSGRPSRGIVTNSDWLSGAKRLGIEEILSRRPAVTTTYENVPVGASKFTPPPAPASMAKGGASSLVSSPLSLAARLGQLAAYSRMRSHDPVQS